MAWRYWCNWWIWRYAAYCMANQKLHTYSIRIVSYLFWALERAWAILVTNESGKHGKCLPDTTSNINIKPHIKTSSSNIISNIKISIFMTYGFVSNQINRTTATLMDWRQHHIDRNNIDGSGAHLNAHHHHPNTCVRVYSLSGASGVQGHILFHSIRSFAKVFNRFYVWVVSSRQQPILVLAWPMWATLGGPFVYRPF